MARRKEVVGASAGRVGAAGGAAVVHLYCTVALAWHPRRWWVAGGCLSGLGSRARPELASGALAYRALFSPSLDGCRASSSAWPFGSSVRFLT